MKRIKQRTNTTSVLFLSHAAAPLGENTTRKEKTQGSRQQRLSLLQNTHKVAAEIHAKEPRVRVRRKSRAQASPQVNYP